MIKKYVLSLLLCNFFCINYASGDEYHILSCTRPLAEKAVFEHCYVKLVHGNRILDSRGFFQDAGSIQEPSPFMFYGKCMEAKSNATLDDWIKVTNAYDKYAPKDYSVTSKNCCSVAYEALRGCNRKPQFFPISHLRALMIEISGLISS